jgi:hypothetical protein
MRIEDLVGRERRSDTKSRIGPQDHFHLRFVEAQLTDVAAIKNFQLEQGPAVSEGLYRVILVPRSCSKCDSANLVYTRCEKSHGLDKVCIS